MSPDAAPQAIERSPAATMAPTATSTPAAPKTSRFTTPGEGPSTLISVVTVVGLIALWWLASHLHWVPPLFLPTPETVLSVLYQSATGRLTDAPLAVHFGWSMFRVFTAFFAACLTAIPIGVAMGVSRVARGIFDPPIEFYRPLPPLAYLPLIVIWFGIDELSKIILIYLACFAPLAMSARAGVRSVSQEQIHAAYSMGATKWQVIWHVIVPAAMPEILTAMRIAIGFGWTTLVAAEMVAANTGLGQMVLNASNFLRTDIVIMGIIVIGVVAYAFDLLMRYVEHVVVPWKGRL
jgi:taurine transport system permease protein